MMKKLKKALSLTLMLALCMGLAVPAFADENGAPMPTDEGVAPISITYEYGYGEIDRDDTLYTYNYMMDSITENQVDAFKAIRSGSRITVSHIGSDPQTFIYIYLQSFVRSAESYIVDYLKYDEVADDWLELTMDINGKYYDDAVYYSYLSNSNASVTHEDIKSVADGTGHYWNTGYFDISIDEDHNIEIYQAVDALTLSPGDSVTFTLPDDGSDTYYQLHAEICYPQYPWYYWRTSNIRIDDALAASAPAEPEQPTTPSTPTTPGTPIPDVVMLSRQNLEVDGKIVECEKYNIDGSNYFKLRDLAQVLSGTGSRFAVGYDEASSTVTITTGAAYESTGTELAVGVDNSATTQPSAQSILIDGMAHGELTVYNIGGSNFFQLRELGSLLGFEVDYDVDTNTAIIRTTGQEQQSQEQTQGTGEHGFSTREMTDEEAKRATDKSGAIYRGEEKLQQAEDGTFYYYY